MTQPIFLRKPSAEDGFAVHQLIEHSPPLDTNSTYCNLLQCSHFAATSVAAFIGDELVGFISGYLVPDRPNTLFIWQVAVSPVVRGRGLATRMIQHILARDNCQQVSHLETTITEDNQASWALFERVAESYAADLSKSKFFDKERHFQNLHDSEILVTIGPLKNASALESTASKLISNY